MDFYNNISKLQPHRVLVDFIKNTPNIKTAIDLGCGAGRDTKFLLKNSKKVIDIDRVDVRKFLYKNLDKNEMENLTFIQSNFSEVELPNADLIISYEALPFCSREELNSIIKKIKVSLNDNGYLLCNFFGKNDEWFGNDKILFLEKEEIKEILSDFNIIKIKEIEQDSETAMHQMKHWHVFWIIAKRNN